MLLPQQVVRRSGRIPKEISIILIGSDLAGRIFSEQTKTVLLSLHGAGLLSRHKLSPEQEMVLRWPERNKEAEIRVVGQIGEDSGVYTYGVAFFSRGEFLGNGISSTHAEGTGTRRAYHGLLSAGLNPDANAGGDATRCGGVIGAGIDRCGEVGQAAIFVAARIVFAQELPEQNLFRYGVQYLHTDRPRGAF